MTKVAEDDEIEVMKFNRVLSNIKCRCVLASHTLLFRFKHAKINGIEF
jgi:hypothetical protein